MRRVHRSLIAAACVGGLLATAAAAPAGQPGVSTARKATAKYHRLAVAERDGYGLLKDAEGIACIDNPGVGGMGVHYAKSKLVGDGKVDLRTPDVLVYDPGPNGQMRLVALEYVVFQKAWDAHHSSPPRLYGREFELVEAGNRYGLDPFYELHAWVWKNNPRGMFDDWNPKVSC
jgi:hypothetical protein